MNTQNKRARFFKTFLLLTVCGAIAYLILSKGIINEDFLSPYPEQNPALGEDELRVHFINTDQSESILIQHGGKAILIDAANQGYEETLRGYLHTKDVSELELFVLTHPHSDHIGSAASVLHDFPVKNLLLPDIPEEYRPESPLYDGVLAAAEEEGCPILPAFPGQEFSLGDGIILSVLGPTENYGTDYNDWSVVCRLSYGDVSFLFTGDMEVFGENDLLFSGTELSATVLKVGHHGSNTSTGEAFLSAVDPEYAVILCGKDNDYHHPHPSTTAALREQGCTVYRSDLDGNIIFTTNGKKISVITEDDSIYFHTYKKS